MHGRRTDFVDDVQLDELVGQKAERPSRVPGGWVAARQLNKLRLGPPIELGFAGYPLLWPSLHCRFDAFQYGSLADTFDRSDANSKLVSNLTIRESVVGFQ